jgi:hypothetical protein
VAQHLKKARGITNAGYQRSNWRNGPKKAQVRAIGDHLRCLERRKDRSKVRAYVAKKRSALRLYRSYRRIATIRCHGGWEGYYVIPCYIVACESRFSWTAYNPSGAAGVYQIMAFHGRPFPVRGFRDRLRHHQIAASLSLSAWVCA